MKIGRMKRRHVRWFFFLYLLLVIRVIIFKYPAEQLLRIAKGWQRGVITEGLKSANFTLFKTIRMYIDYSYMLNSFENLVGNVAVFIPFGLLFPCVSKKGEDFLRMLFWTLLFSAGLESFQLVSGFGAFDVDDILLNAAGAVTGYLIYRFCVVIMSRHAGGGQSHP